jgi:antitoxin (DNA-binding transcriptional repressor) of toxin-antitoxin stability system
MALGFRARGLVSHSPERRLGSVRWKSGGLGLARLVVEAATHEFGNGTYTVMTQLAAEVLGVAIEESGCAKLQLKPMNKPAIRVSEAGAANDFPSLLARVRAGAEVVIERNAEAVAVLRPAAPNVRLLSESRRLAQERGSNTTLDEEFGRDLETVVSNHREPLTPPASD